MSFNINSVKQNSAINLQSGNSQSVQKQQNGPGESIFSKGFDDLNKADNNGKKDNFIDLNEFSAELLNGLNVDQNVATSFKDKAIALFNKFAGSDKKLDETEFNQMKAELNNLKSEVQGKKSDSFETVKNLLADEFGEDDELTPQSSLADDLGLDQMDTVSILMNIEKKYGIEISDQEASNIHTVQDLMNLIDNKVNND